MQPTTIKFIDLFAGMGGTRVGFEEACQSLGYQSECVFTSEIKPYAVELYAHNFGDHNIHGDITSVDEKNIPDFDFLLGGFPCQAFSVAGKRAGFNDTRGTLFFDIARILLEKKPKGFILENVEGLVTHDKIDQQSKIGNTLKTILEILEDIGYHVSWQTLNAKDFGVPQDRKRIYIIGHKDYKPIFPDYKPNHRNISNIQEHNLESLDTLFTRKLLELFTPEDLFGKSIKDKRGGEDNIHSWDIEIRGKISDRQKEIMSILLKERRKKKWAELKGITWMDGMPLTLDEIHSFYAFIDKNELKDMLDDLVNKTYLRFEHPKELINGKREYAYDKEKGYNIVTGKLSFELNKILSPHSIAPTIVATETDRIGIIDNGKIRRLSSRECLRLFGFPDWYNSNVEIKYLYDLVGNTVVVPVIRHVAKSLLTDVQK